ncbi:MAG TPA: aspartate aminotransferase family protein [Acidobacteriaceae bacterium]|nr:aspartate aminotransferase family protein [Acidobacteriaceae bacterium]
MLTSDLAVADRQHQIHPLHHPVDLTEPVICVKGRGINVWDINGNKYVDGLSALWNVNVGHGRAELADAAAEQMKELAYFSSYAGSANIPSINLAQRLTELAPGMEAVFFSSGGAEANESAFKTARYYWKTQDKPDKLKIISRIHGYHGVTLQAMSATGIAGYWKMFEPRVPGFLHVPTCYPYRTADAKAGETPGQTAARQLEEAILREGPDTVAAFIGEPIHGAGGVIYPTDDYWPLVREICTRYQVLLIVDEIITGFGRTGRWFASEHWNIRPDILSFAKGVTSGYVPLGGIMMTRAIKDAIESVDPAKKWMHGYTNSGQPTCCAVALKNIEIIEREGLREHSAKMGDFLLQALIDTFGDHPNTGDVRGGKGLLAAVEFVEDRATRKNFAAEKKIGATIQAEMKKRGVLTRTRPAGGEHPAPGDEVLFAPPLVITKDEIISMVSVLRESVEVVLGPGQ